MIPDVTPHSPNLLRAVTDQVCVVNEPLQFFKLTPKHFLSILQGQSQHRGQRPPSQTPSYLHRCVIWSSFLPPPPRAPPPSSSVSAALTSSSLINHTSCSTNLGPSELTFLRIHQNVLLFHTQLTHHCILPSIHGNTQVYKYISI